MILSLSVLPANPGTPAPVKGNNDSENVFEDIVTALLPAACPDAPAPDAAEIPEEATNAGQATAESSPESGPRSHVVSAGFTVSTPGTAPGLPVPEAEAAGTTETPESRHHPEATWQRPLENMPTGLCASVPTGGTTLEKLEVGNPLHEAKTSPGLPVSGSYPALSPEPATPLGQAPTPNPAAGALDGHARESGGTTQTPVRQTAVGVQTQSPRPGMSVDAVANLPLAVSATTATPAGPVSATTSSPRSEAPVPHSATFTAPEAQAEPEPATGAETVLPTPVHGGTEPDAPPWVPLASPPVTSQGSGTSLTPQGDIAGLETVRGSETHVVENAVSRGTQPPPINRQLAGPIAVLATGPHGERTLSINIAPEALGPVTVKAHLGHEGLRVELTAPTEAGREALRAMLPELRRDLAATGAGNITIGTNAEHATGSGNGGANPGTTGDQRFGTATPGYPPRGRSADDVPSAPLATGPAAAAQHSTHLDVMA